MVKDTGLILESDQLMNTKRIDLIFCQVNHHKPNMTFEVFMQALVKLGDFKFPEMPSNRSLKMIVHDFL